MKAIYEVEYDLRGWAVMRHNLDDPTDVVLIAGPVDTEQKAWIELERIEKDGE